MRHLFDRFINRGNVNLDISNKCTLECIACSRQTNRFAGYSIPVMTILLFLNGQNYVNILNIYVYVVKYLTYI